MAVGKGLHPSNRHRERYDFAALMQASPDLAKAVSQNAFGELSIDFANPESVILLNQALLNHHYQVEFWDLPAGYLCPPIPGRADYLHHLADLFAATPGKTPDAAIPTGKKLRLLDIGMGANCIYPILGTRLYGWTFVGSDIDPISVNTANMIADMNPNLKGRIRCRTQAASKHIFDGIIQPDEFFDATLCNPPFHRSLAEAHAGSDRKIANLAANSARKLPRALQTGKPEKARQSTVLNFGGQGAELWCDGGEAEFIRQMIKESVKFARQCLWFSTLVSNQDRLPSIYQQLTSARVAHYKTIDMQQGQKQTRIVAWTFLSDDDQREWCHQRWASA